MKLTFTAFLAVVMIFAFAPPALAQSVEYTRFLQVLNNVNSPRPDNSSQYERSREIFSNRVLDSRNKVLGEVKDVILNKNGSISALHVDFNRMGMAKDTLFINYRDLRTRPASNGYKLGFSEEQLEVLFPSLLANIETAAGGENTHSARKLVGTTVKTEGGKKIGRVNDVLFNANGGRAELLYIAMIAGALRGKNVAIPFNKAKYHAAGKNVKITVTEDQASAMVDYAEEQ